MPAAQGRFDCLLSYPQWQGSGRFENLPRGAEAAAEILEKYGRVVRVPITDTGQAAGGINRWSAILDQFRAAQAILFERRPDRVLTAGGDCACDIAIIDYLHRRYPDLNVIWIDAHLDANTAATSPSGNFHGMPVASILGGAPEQLVGLLAGPLQAADFHYVSAHVGDEGDWTFQRANGLSWLEDDTLITGPVHIHFDLDVLDPAEFPHIAYPDGNLPVATGLALVTRIAEQADIVGLTITEFAPVDSIAAANGGEFIRKLCEAAGADRSG